MNAKETMQALLDGKKIRDSTWSTKGTYFHLVDGKVIDERGKRYSPDFHYDWVVVEEPKTVTLWRRMYRAAPGMWSQSYWYTAKEKTLQALVGLHEYGPWESKTFTVEES